MGVMACSRKGCDNILCERYNVNFGYVCNSCFDALTIAQRDDPDFTIEGFMRSDVNSMKDKKVDLNEVFPL